MVFTVYSFAAAGGEEGRREVSLMSGPQWADREHRCGGSVADHGLLWVSGRAARPGRQIKNKILKIKWRHRQILLFSFACFDIQLLYILWSKLSTHPWQEFQFWEKIKFKISDSPEVVLGREDGANLRTLSPGEDIALKCAVMSSPLHHTILWTKQVRIRSVDLLCVRLLWLNLFSTLL